MDGRTPQKLIIKCQVALESAEIVIAAKQNT